MSYQVIFSSKATKEAEEQALYLDEQRPGYGHKFLEGLKSVSESLSKQPTTYPTTIPRPDLRRVNMPKPFNKSHSIYYHFDGGIIRILCVFTNRRSEKIWQRR